METAQQALSKDYFLNDFLAAVQSANEETETVRARTFVGAVMASADLRGQLEVMSLATYKRAVCPAIGMLPRKYRHLAHQVVRDIRFPRSSSDSLPN